MQLEMIKEEPVSKSDLPPLLFVHGMWHGAWCWAEHFLPYFARHGYKAHAFSLRGHGTSEGRDKLRWTSMADYVADVAQMAAQFEQPPILVGHSMGGMVVQKYLESHAATAAILLASAPPTGVIPTTLRTLWRHPWPFLKVNLTMRMYPIVGTPTLAKDALFSADLPDEKLAAYFPRLQNDSYRVYLDMLLLDLPKPARIQTPLLVLGGADDRLFPPGDIERTAQIYDTEATIFPNMAHNMMLEAGWQAVADHMLNWLAERQ